MNVWTIVLLSRFHSTAYNSHVYNAIDGNRPDAGLPVIEKALYDRQGQDLGETRGRLIAALAESKRQLRELSELTEAQSNLEKALALAMLHLRENVQVTRQIHSLMEGHVETD